MHILHITREFGSDARYGISKSLAPVTEALRERGVTVEVFDGDAAREQPPGRLASWIGRQALALIRRRYVHSDSEHAAAQAIVNMLAERVAIAWSAARHARKIGVTHVHCHDPVLAYLYARFALVTGATRRWGVTEHGFGAYVQERQGVPIPLALLKALQKWERKVAQSAAWLFAPSRLGLRQLALDLHLPAELAGDVPPANWHVVGHPRPSLQHYERTQARIRLAIPEDDWIVLAVGQLVPMKRFLLLIEACGLVAYDLRPNLIILGEGDSGTLLEAAQHLGMERRLRIEVTDDIGLYFAAADVYASTSATESFGMANCEALYAGLPAVCTAVGAVPEVVGNAAWLVGDSATEIAAALSALRSDVRLRRHFAEKARLWGLDWRGPKEIADEIERIYAAAP